mmetsp:Transcript_523/g.1264  ORF Transcript_523/g.1264 Transcript_523/m.1264 type:complete len:249 (+) Transcript_523:239-985(+)
MTGTAPSRSSGTDGRAQRTPRARRTTSTRSRASRSGTRHLSSRRSPKPRRVRPPAVVCRARRQCHPPLPSPTTQTTRWMAPILSVPGRGMRRRCPARSRSREWRTTGWAARTEGTTRGRSRATRSGQRRTRTAWTAGATLPTPRPPKKRTPRTPRTMMMPLMGVWTAMASPCRSRKAKAQGTARSGTATPPSGPTRRRGEPRQRGSGATSRPWRLPLRARGRRRLPRLATLTGRGTCRGQWGTTHPGS